MTETLSVRFDNLDYDCLQALSLLTGKSMAVLVIDAIRTSIKNADIGLLEEQRVAEVREAAGALWQYTGHDTPIGLK